MGRSKSLRITTPNWRLLNACSFSLKIVQKVATRYLLIFKNAQTRWQPLFDPGLSKNLNQASLNREKGRKKHIWHLVSHQARNFFRSKRLCERSTLCRMQATQQHLGRPWHHHKHLDVALFAHLRQRLATAWFYLHNPTDLAAQIWMDLLLQTARATGTILWADRISATKSQTWDKHQFLSVRRCNLWFVLSTGRQSAFVPAGRSESQPSKAESQKLVFVCIWAGSFSTQNEF